MDRTLTLYEAKARFSEVLRLVGEGATIVVTVRGRKVARIIPYGDETIDARLARLVASGRLTPPRVAGGAGPRPRGRRQPGALDRFLAERD